MVFLGALKHSLHSPFQGAYTTINHFGLSFIIGIWSHIKTSNRFYTAVLELKGCLKKRIQIKRNITGYKGKLKNIYFENCRLTIWCQ